MEVKLVSKTSLCEDYREGLKIENNLEALIAYLARVSSPNQDNPNYESLIKFLIRNKHWSPFEMVTMCVEISTSRAIAQQILRHRSFSFQEFSQRYSIPNEFELYEARSQDDKNRQNSIDNLDNETKEWWIMQQKEVALKCFNTYQDALNKGIAKECARNVLPLSTKTKLYMNGSIRSWIHYLGIRCDNATQKEHQDVALKIKEIFIKEFPIISKALGWML